MKRPGASCDTVPVAAAMVAGVRMYTGDTAMPIRTRMTNNMRAPLLILFGAVSFVLLIACVNFSSLLMTRTASRAQEFQVRMALGAGRWRVLRQIVTESVVIAIFGAVAGILLAELASRLLLTLKPEDLRDLNAPVLNTTTLLFAIAISALCGIVFGLAPASQLLAGRTNIHSSSRSTTTRSPSGCSFSWAGAFFLSLVAVAIAQNLRSVVRKTYG